MDVKQHLALVDGTTVTEAENAEAVVRIRQRSSDAAEAFRQRLAMGEANSNAIGGSDVPSPIALASTCTDAQLRAMLAEAIVKHADAQRVFDTVTLDLERARERMVAADAELSIYDDLDQRVAQWHVQQVKSNRSDPLPRELMEAQSIRSTVAEIARTSKLAYDQIQRECQSVAAKLNEHAAVRARIATSVITKFATTIGMEIAECIDAIVDARRKLASISSTWVALGEYSGAVPLTQSAKAALHMDVEVPVYTPDYQDAVKAWHAALLIDATAVIAWE